jgi:iron complex outermembrane receptor protein
MTEQHRAMSRVRLAALAGAAFCAAQPAFAQADPTPPSAANNSDAAAERPSTAAGGLEDIVVTATRSTTNLQDTPVAITALTAQALSERSFTSVQDIAAVVPNAAFSQANASFGRTLQAYIRGIGQNDFSLAFEPGVAFYVDDQYYALSTGSIFDLLDLERVEVLRGPQGTVFGRNAIGGAVNLIPKAPSNTQSGYVEATYGRYNRQDIRAGFNMPLTDHLFFRVSGVSKSRRGYQQLLDFRCDMIRRGTPQLAGNFPSLDGSNGFLTGKPRDNCLLGRYGGEDVQAVRGALRWDGPGVDVTVSADYTNDDSPLVANKQIRIVQTAGSIALDNQVYQPLFGISYDQRFITDSPFKTYATYADPIPGGSKFPAGCTNVKPVPAGQVACNWYNGDPIHGGINLERKAVIRNYGFGGKAVFDVTDKLTATLLGGYRNVYTTALNDSDGSPLSLQTVKTQISFHSVTAEPRLNYTSDLFDLTVGGFYYKSRGLTTNNVSAAFLNYQQNQYVIVRAESKAAYAQAVVHPFDGFSVTLGGRYSDDNKNVNYNETGTNRISQIADLGVSRWDYRFGADYQATHDITIYGSVASGYRPPAYNPRPFQATQVQSVGEEAAVSYELGFKGDLFDRRLRVNIAGFYTDFSTRITSRAGSECLNSGVEGQCNVPGVQVDPAVTGGATLCRAATAAELAAPNLARGIGVTCVSKTNYFNTPGKIKGLEAEIEARPVDGLLINLSGGYTNFDAPELKADPATVNTTPVYVPEWTGSAGIAYEVQTPGLSGSITPRLDALYQSKISFNARSNFAQIPGRTTFNGRLTYQNDGNDWMVALGATNLFNKRYYYNIFDLVPFGQVGTEGQPGRPREWYLTVKKSF